MAPKKDGPSKKNEQKKKAKNVEDRTFGLKNKNKSKKVQQHIQSVTSSVMNSGDRKQRAQEEQRKKVKADQKNRKKAALDEQNALFGEALMAVKKKGSTSQQDGKIEAKGRDHDDEGAKKGTSRAMKMMFQMDAQEMEDKLKEDVSFTIICYVSCHVLREKTSKKSQPCIDLSLSLLYLFLRYFAAQLCTDTGG
jgi:hypothetical protein